MKPEQELKIWEYISATTYSLTQNQTLNTPNVETFNISNPLIRSQAHGFQFPVFHSRLAVFVKQARWIWLDTFDRSTKIKAQQNALQIFCDVMS